MLRTLTSVFLTPPGINLAIILFGCLIRRHFSRLGSILIIVGAASLWLLSTPLFSALLHESIEKHPALTLAQNKTDGAQAIVVLGAAQFDNAAEFEGNTTPSEEALSRIHLTAFLHRKTQLPIMTTGGPMNRQQDVHADVMAAALAIYGVPVKWRERRSATTWQNALFSAEALLPLGINNIILVTHSYHMQRAADLFQTAGFKVIAAPTQLSTRYPLNALWYWLPNTRSLRLSHRVMHEYIGLLWYRFVSPIGNSSERDYKLEVN